jgi:hypothetical protein
VSAAERLIALLEQPDASGAAVRQVIGSLRRTPQEVVERFDHYQRLVEGVGAEQAVRIVLNAARVAHKGWLA